jgi:glucan 1,3-beta-glucosidase
VPLAGGTTWYDTATRRSGDGTWRDVQKGFGAKGDGSADDTQAIRTALTQGRPAWQDSTRSPAVVFFPPGTYLITDTLPSYMCVFIRPAAAI